MASIVLTPTGVHFIQVAKWLGRSSYVLTLTPYADYTPEQEIENRLPEPVAAVEKANVVEHAPLDGGLDMAACRRSRTIRYPGTTIAALSLIPPIDPVLVG